VQQLYLSISQRLDNELDLNGIPTLLAEHHREIDPG
jgi:hypothetical protein